MQIPPKTHYNLFNRYKQTPRQTSTDSCLASVGPFSTPIRVTIMCTDLHLPWQQQKTEDLALKSIPSDKQRPPSVISRYLCTTKNYPTLPNSSSMVVTICSFSWLVNRSRPYCIPRTAVEHVSPVFSPYF